MSRAIWTVALILLTIVSGYAGEQKTGIPTSRILYDFASTNLPGFAPNGGVQIETGTNNVKLIFQDQGNYQGFNLTPEQRDWSGYDFFVVDAVNPSEQNLKVSFEGVDGKSSWKEQPRGTWNIRFGAFDSVWMPPGHSTVALRINPSLLNNEIRPVDLTDIRSIVFWVENPSKGLVLTLNNIRLLKSEALAETPQTWLDFESGKELKWHTLELTGTGEKTPPVFGSTGFPVKVETGERGLKLTFSGGRFPTVTTGELPAFDLTPRRTFMTDVIVNRTCVVIFRIVYEHQDDVKPQNFPRWEKAALCPPGTNTVIEEFQSDPKLGKPVAFEIGMYNPHPEESIHIGNVRFLRTTPAVSTPFRDRNIIVSGQFRIRFPVMQSRWKVLELTESFANLSELAKKFRGDWVKPDPTQPLSFDSVEKEMQSRLTELQKEHPEAVLVVFRQGQPGFDLSRPEQIYTGWSDTYLAGHDPTSAFLQRTQPFGREKTYEVFLRRRCPLIRIDVSSIPQSAEILAAQLVLTRSDKPDPTKISSMSPYKPTFFVAEACNRPWIESEENIFEYAKDKFWHEISGMDWDGNDPDFLPLIIAYGQSNVGVSRWNFTEAVRYWRTTGNMNHGFALTSIEMDYMNCFSAKAKQLSDRPALLVIYEPKKSNNQ